LTKVFRAVGFSRFFNSPGPWTRVQAKEQKQCEKEKDQEDQSISPRQRTLARFHAQAPTKLTRFVLVVVLVLGR
jgi:hypothetical protein